jgi:hypothetical protein
LTTLQVNKVVNVEHCVKIHIHSKGDGFHFTLVPVYGAAHDNKKPEFLAELVHTCDGETLPLLIGGDFKIIRRKEISRGKTSEAP